MKADRRAFEVTVLLITFLLIGYPLLSSVPGRSKQTQWLLALTGLAVLQEHSVPTGPLEGARHATSQGVAVGALAVPWTFAGLLCATARHHLPTDFHAFALGASIGASALMVSFLALASYSQDTGRKAGGVKVPGSSRGPVHVRCRASDGAGALMRRSCTADNGLCASSSLKNFIEMVQGRNAAAFATGGGGILLFLLIVLDSSRGVHQPDSGQLTAILRTVAIPITSVLGLRVLLSALPICFTIGEAMVVSTGVSLLGWDMLLLGFSGLAQLRLSLQSPEGLSSFTFSGHLEHRTQVSLFCELLVAACLGVCLLAAPLLRRLCTPSRKGRPGAGPRSMPVPAAFGLLAALLGGGALLAVGPAVWALQFAFATWRRAGILAFWVGLLAVSLPLMDWLSHSRRVPTIIVRKGYHLLALALFSPALVWEPQLLAISLSIAAAALMVVEAVRVGNVPFLGTRIDAFMTSFIDSRDSGPVLITHFSLLLGMAVPVWLSSIPSTPPGDTVPDLATAFTGILILGIADSAASAIGRALGRHRILDTSKTVEGTLGGIVFCLAAWLVTWATCLLRTSGLQGWSAIGNLAVATTVSCLLEAATTQLDNIFLPLHHLALMAAAT